MGACNFDITGYGSSMSDAYKNLVDDALHSSGHNAYNGTISTTSGFADKTDRFNALLGSKRKTQKLIYSCIVDWELEAEEATEKWGACWGTKLPDPKETKKRQKYHFCGWAAE
jgi:hypothetical protein